MHALTPPILDCAARGRDDTVRQGHFEWGGVGAVAEDASNLAPPRQQTLRLRPHRALR